MTASITRFEAGDSAAIRNYYRENGYVVVGQLLSDAKIDRLLEILEQKKSARFFVFKSQDTHLPMQPRLTPEGFLENSMLNPGNLKLAPGFARAVESCVTDEAVSELLTVLSGAPGHVMRQTMLFYQSTGTIEHQDHYYLDSDPPGNMIAAWYALEDIHEDAGCFFVLPGSHKGRLIERQGRDYADHEEYRHAIGALIEEARYEYLTLPLRKGDVLFWHPYTIHGADKNQNPRHSRKSVTAHFIPRTMASFYGEKYPQARPSMNPHITIHGGSAYPYWDSVKSYIRFAANIVRRRGPHMVMRREHYGERA
ncbi:MAG: aminotransferase [Gammaproteobacteria bacterium]|nr:aminotransferase [Gammaproteobacteria bacterium]